MAKRPTISNIASGYTSTTTLNDNFTKLVEAFDNTLSLDGSTPNTMRADLDLGGNSIANVGGLVVEGQDIVAVTRGYRDSASTSAIAAAESENLAGLHAEVTRSNLDSLSPYFDEIQILSDDLVNGDFVAGSIYDFGSITSPTTGTSGSPDGFIVQAVNNLDDIETVATNIASVNTVAGIETEIVAVEANETNINTVGSIASDVTSVASISTDVSSTAGIASDITAVAADATDIGTVAGGIANVNTVAGISGDITAVVADASDIGTVAADIADVSSVATNIADVSTVAGISADVSSVAADATDIGTVATDIANVNTVASLSAAIATVNANSTNINTVATNDANINTVAGVSTDVTTVAGVSTDVTTVAGISADVSAVAGISTEISAVQAQLAEVQTVANDLNEVTSEIDTVAQSIANVDAVGTDIADVNTVATNIANVTTAASNSADISAVAAIDSNVSTVAGINTDVTTVSGISADVSSVAGISANVTTVAGDSADISTVASISADVSTAAGIASDIGVVAGDSTDIATVAADITSVNTVATNMADVNSFGETYRIGTADPTTSLDVGDLFFNSTTGVLKVYDGSGWTAGVTAGSGFLALTGGTLTGTLTLDADPTTNLGAATKQYVDAEVAGVVDAAPATLNTLNELAAALGDDDNFATTTANNLATKLPLAGGTMTGDITFNSTQLFDGRDVSADGSKLDGIEAGAKDDQTITAGSGLTGGGTGNVTLNHADTSSQDSVNNSGATVIQDVTVDTYGHVTGLGSKTLSYTDVGAQVAGTYNTVIGTDSDINTSGSTIIDNIYVTDGVITSMGTRTLTLADLGYTGATNANYITNNNQLSNGAGYTTFTANQSLNTSSSPTFNTVTAANFNTTSDARLKSNVETLTDSLEKVKDLRGVSFDWKATHAPDIGFIAQEVAEVLPEMVSHGDEGTLSVKYSNIVAVLVEAIKEQQAQIDELKEKVGV